ncbi:MAG: RtcB family protein [Myxococcota bacterium]
MSDGKLRTWTFEPLSGEVRRALERLTRTDGVVAVAAMPDVHLASDVCVGTVVASSLLFPAAVGGCIGCGMAAIAFDADAEVLDSAGSAARVLGGLGAYVPILKHRDAQALTEMLETGRLSAEVLEKKKERDGRVQIGTLGRGNHFLEFQRDDENRLWLMVHSGSRGIGQLIRDHHLKRATPTNTGLLALAAESSEGEAYLNDMNWALAYAAENRRRLVDTAVVVMKRALGITADETSLFGCHHLGDHPKPASEDHLKAGQS